MTIERLNEQISIPYHEQDFLKLPEESRAGLRKIARRQGALFELFVKRINQIVSLLTGSTIYMATPNEDGTYPEGTWRWRVVGSGLTSYVELQQLQADGSWDAKARFRP